MTAAICQHRLEVHSSGRAPRIAYVCSRMEHPDDPWHEVELPVEKDDEHLVDVDEHDAEARAAGSRFRWRGA